MRGIVLSFTTLQILQYCITVYRGFLNRRIRLLSVIEKQDRVVSLEYLCLEKLEFRPTMPFYALFHEQIISVMFRFLAMFKFQSANYGLPSQPADSVDSYS